MLSALTNSILIPLDDVCGAIERGDAVIVSGKEYRTKLEENSSVTGFNNAEDVDSKEDDSDGENEIGSSTARTENSFQR